MVFRAHSEVIIVLTIVSTTTHLELGVVFKAHLEFVIGLTIVNTKTQTELHIVLPMNGNVGASCRLWVATCTSDFSLPSIGSWPMGTDD